MSDPVQLIEIFDIYGGASYVNPAYIKRILKPDDKKDKEKMCYYLEMIDSQQIQMTKESYDKVMTSVDVIN